MSARNDEGLAGLMEEIERAWIERQDDSVVDRLAKEHPELAERLYLFFATVVDAPDELDRKRPELSDSAARTREWLTREGFTRAANSGQPDATPTRRVAEEATYSFVGLLRQLTQASPRVLAAELEITPDFLVEVSSHAAVLPLEAKHELARRANKARGIAVERVLASLETPVLLQRAASRDEAYAATSVTYDELVSQSQMSNMQKRYWSKFGRKGG